MIVIFAGGGTGGHLMPALALADELVRQNAEVEPLFIGAERGIEASVLPQRPWRYVLLPAQPIYRTRWWRNVALPLSVLRVLSGFRRILNEERPALVVGTGGYVAGPVLWAAAARGVPTAIQEQNSYPGIATRWLAGRVRQIHLGFPEAAAYLKPGSSEVYTLGNPVLPPPPPGERIPRDEAKRALGFGTAGAAGPDALARPPQPLVLVLGGSQGALAINRAIAEALSAGLWPSGVHLLWQAGARTAEAFRRFAEPGRVSVVAFLDPIQTAYAAADLVVARAGAMTLAEIAAWGLPSILVPLPTAAADHQTANANAMADAGAAVCLPQAEATGPRLAREVGALVGDPAAMTRLASGALARGRPDALREIGMRMLTLIR